MAGTLDSTTVFTWVTTPDELRIIADKMSEDIASGKYVGSITYRSVGGNECTLNIKQLVSG